MKLTTTLIRISVDFEYGRAKGLGYIQTLMTFGTFFEVLKINNDINRWWYAVIIPCAFIGTWWFGRFLRKIKWREREQTFIVNENKYLMAVHKKLNDD